MKFWSSLIVLLSVSGWQISADTPANCTYEDIKGYWLLEESEPNKDYNEKCANVSVFPRQTYIRLDFPNIVTDKYGNIGTWTIVYNQGFEVTINYRKYFSFSAFEKRNEKVISYCYKTLTGWSHNVLGKNWACFKGYKITNWEKLVLLKDATQAKEHQIKSLYLENINVLHSLSQKHVDKINSLQKSWTATLYPEIQSKTLKQLIRMSGGRSARIVSRPKPKVPSEEIIKESISLPEWFDWRNVNGINYVSPVRDQGSCGSCYAFASMALLESRIRIITNNTEQPIFSTQNIVDCSEYSQGCEGGFPYLIAGKYAQDFGVIDDSCYPYKGIDSKCTKKNLKNSTCSQKTYAIRYHYIGGYYGACNEEMMRIELVRNGPIVVGFEVYDDFYHYKHGIYSHLSYDKNQVKSNKTMRDFNPFELTNHAVLIVGYGKNKTTGEKYWIVKNSWGEKWGINGYFLIRRGTDECGIESLAVAATPIIN